MVIYIKYLERVSSVQLLDNSVPELFLQNGIKFQRDNKVLVLFR